jgi:hypothetical protein
MFLEVLLGVEIDKRTFLQLIMHRDPEIKSWIQEQLNNDIDAPPGFLHWLQYNTDESSEYFEVFLTNTLRSLDTEGWLSDLQVRELGTTGNFAVGVIMDTYISYRLPMALDKIVQDYVKVERQLRDLGLLPPGSELYKYLITHD